VRRWWDEGTRLPYPEAEIEHYRAALQGEPTYRYVAHIDARPVGMFQHYRIGDSPEYAAALGLDEEAVGVDLFIGEAELVGRGHGPAMLRAFLRDVAFPRTWLRYERMRRRDSGHCESPRFPMSPIPST